MTDKQITHEYAGFRYVMTRDDDGDWRATPVEGQHRAASKEKHIRAAIETFAELQK